MDIPVENVEWRNFYYSFLCDLLCLGLIKLGYTDFFFLRLVFTDRGEKVSKFS